MADVQYGKPNPSDGFPVRAADVSGVGTAYAEEVVPVGYDAATLSYYKFAVDTNGNLQVGIAGGGTVLPVGQIQVGGTSGTSTNVGFGAGQLAVPVNVIAGGAGGGLSQLQVWGSGTAGTWTDVGFGTASGTANLSVPVVFAGTATVAGTVTTIPTGTQSVAQVTSPWVVGGTTTSVPSGTQSVAQTGSPWGVSGTVTAVESGTWSVTVSGTAATLPAIAYNAGISGTTTPRIVQALANVANITQTAIGTTTTTIIAANANRIKVRITNTGTNPAYIGTSTAVTTANGDFLVGIAGYPWISRYEGALIGITSSGTTIVSVYEESSQ